MITQDTDVGFTQELPSKCEASDSLRTFIKLVEFAKTLRAMIYAHDVSEEGDAMLIELETVLGPDPDYDGPKLKGKNHG